MFTHNITSLGKNKIFNTPVVYPTRPKHGFSAHTNFERDWLYNRAIRFIPQHIVDEAITARRPEETPELVQASFNKFEVPYHKIVRDDHYANALKWVHNEGKPNRKLHPVSFPDLRYYPWNLPPNAEAPWNIPGFRFKPTFRNVDGESDSPKLQELVGKTFSFFLRGSITVEEYLKLKQASGMTFDSRVSFHNLLNEIFIRNRFHVHEIKDKDPKFWHANGTPKPYYWNTMHIKTTVVAADDPDKIRVIFGAPKLVLMVENMFLWPLQATYLNTEKGFLLWGREMIRGGWKKIVKELSELGPDLCYFMADWKQWDKRLMFELQDDVHSIWRSYFDFTKYEPTSYYPTGATDPQRIENLWTWMCHSIKHTPILLPDDTLAIWNYSGFGSGYQQTQLMDSFANAIVTLTILGSMGIDIFRTLRYLKVQGDDIFATLAMFCYHLFGSTFISKFKEAALYYFNMEIDLEVSRFLKSLKGATVLSYECKNGLPFRTEIDLLQHLFFPKSPRDWAQLAGSALGLAYANAGIHRRYHDLCCYIWNKIVHEKLITPSPLGLPGIFEQTGTRNLSQFDEFTTLVFPTWHQLCGLVETHTPRSDSEKLTLWPQEHGKKGNFYFLLPL